MDGIIVQLPLDTTSVIDADSVIDRIDRRKDVDGLTRENAGRLARGEMNGTIVPCTPRGCLHLVQRAVGHADPRTTERYWRRKDALDDNAVDYVKL